MDENSRTQCATTIHPDVTRFSPATGQRPA
jgi:hypothetical protein